MFVACLSGSSRTRVGIVGILKPKFDGTGIKEMVVRVGLFGGHSHQINVILACELMLTVKRFYETCAQTPPSHEDNCLVTINLGVKSIDSVQSTYSATSYKCCWLANEMVLLHEDVLQN